MFEKEDNTKCIPLWQPLELPTYILGFVNMDVDNPVILKPPWTTSKPSRHKQGLESVFH